MPEITTVATSFEELATAVKSAAENNLHLTVKEARDEASDTVVYHLKTETRAARKIRNLFSSETGKDHDRKVKNAFLVFANKLKAEGHLDDRERLSLAVFEDALRETHTNNLHGSRSVVWSGLLKEAFEDRDVTIPVSQNSPESHNFTAAVREETKPELPPQNYLVPEKSVPQAYEEPVVSQNTRTLPIEPYAVVDVTLKDTAGELEDAPAIPPRDTQLSPQDYLEPRKSASQAYDHLEPVVPRNTRTPVEPYAVVDVTRTDTASELDDAPVIPPRDTQAPPQDYLEPKKSASQAYDHLEPIESGNTPNAPVEPYAVVDVTPKDT